MSLQHVPMTLGPVDCIDVMAIASDATVGSVNDFVRSSAVIGKVTLVDEVDVARIAALWRALPPGESARCHTPPFALRFWLKGECVLEASVCWACDNVYGYASDRPIHFAFDSKSSVAHSLFLQCQHVLQVGAA